MMSTRHTTPPKTPPTSSPLDRQLRLFKRLAAVLLVLLLGGAGFYVYQRRQGQPVAIALDETPVVTVRSLAAADQIMDEAEHARVGAAYPKDSVVLLQKVTLRRVPADAPLDTDDAARAKLARALKMHVRAYVILVNGQPSVGLPTNQAALDTLHAVKEHFANMPPPTEIIKEPEFTEKVTVAERAVDPSRAHASAASAAPYFWTPPPAKSYTVQPGDTGGRIAARSHISLTDLILANPGRNLNKLQPGDRLGVAKAPLLLTVRVQKRQTRDEPVIAHAPAATAGLRRVTYLVTYTNGQETYREPQSMTLLQKPRTRSSL